MDAKQLATKYHGKMADAYDAEREGTPQWVSEQRIVEAQLSSFAPGATVLDVPVGTGRFLAAYARAGFDVTGVDVSTAMLAKAREKVAPGATVRLREGSIYSLDFPDDAFDLVVCIRFLDWVSGDSFQRAMAELTRVSRSAIIAYIPTYSTLAGLQPFSMRGFSRLFRQWKLKAYRVRTQGQSVVHTRREVESTFRRVGLQVEALTCMDDASERTWRMGVERDIYLLRKRPPG